MSSESLPEQPLSLRRLAVMGVPALVIGVLSAVVLWLLDTVAEHLEHLVWSDLPGSLGLDPDSGLFTFTILTLTGLAVGLVVWLAPGHGGRDSATVELLAPLVKLRALPGIAVAIVLGLAGGVSLGPESPIIAINTVIAVSLLTRFAPRFPAELGMLVTAAGTIGAMFGTPVAAALVFTGIVAAARTGGVLWDRMFLPLTAAGAGAFTMSVLGGGAMVIDLPDYGAPQPLDLLTASVVAVGAAGFAILGILLFPHVHRLFHALKHPVIYITLGGAVLGVLGVIGGPITLFKGLHQMGELVAGRDGFDAAQLVLISLVKLLALVIAASAGFRGGRIFPAVFVGVAVGLLGHLLIPALPVGLAVAAGVLGLTLAVARDGWLALFMAVAVTGDVTALPMLCIVVLPTWLLVRSAPEMIVHVRDPKPVEPGES